MLMDFSYFLVNLPERIGACVFLSVVLNCWSRNTLEAVQQHFK
uniref:Uncharacterized protein n=1 Tax=Arundo donax TaxID=35708 RepID=A0A0A9BTK8_ARUDO